MEKNFVSRLHNSTKRDYLKRMINDKVKCMKIAKKYELDYWDGNRKYGYGGYKYIPGRWKKVAKKIIKEYKLTKGSKILDVGCGKGYLLYEMLLIQPGLKIYGIDISHHAIKNSFKIKNLILSKTDARKKLPYQDKYFDLVISLATLHNFELFDLFKAVKEIERVAKKKYIMVESYRSNQELFNLQCWALTCSTFFSKKEWVYLFQTLKYKGDYEFIYFK
jgi:ubiquinone/menaquinone biosynthesis C-methylase UbiE